MAVFRDAGQRWQILREEKNYWQQAVTKREKAGCLFTAAGIMILTGWLFYHSLWAVIVVSPFGMWIYRYLKKEKMEQKKSMFLLQFKEMTESVAQALNVGYSAENAFKEAAKEMKVLYPGKSMIGMEMDYMIRKLKLQIPLEQILEEFSRRVGLEDVRNFSTVFSSAKKSGGDMIAIIQNTSTQISEKVDVKREIDIILASKKYEFRIMCMIPYIMILYMQFSFPEFMGVLYGNVLGIGVMTVCLGIYILACVFGLKLIKIDV